MVPSHEVADSAASRHQESPFRVQGIAMIVDQRGVGARLVVRYPTAPTRKSSAPPEPTLRSAVPPEADHVQQQASGDDDLFFTLTARQMAKLFRTKKAMCGQPMTLSVNGTVFCCRAVLMDGDETATSTVVDDDPAKKDHPLILFSVIVAMSAPMEHTSVPFSSWLDGATEDQLDLHRYLKENNGTSTTTSDAAQKRASTARVSSSFLSIRRVHISLARYCRVLEREERRCRYVSMQVDQLFQLRSERQKQWEEQQKVVRKSASSGSGKHHGAGSKTTNTISSSASVMSATGSSKRRGRHSRTLSIGKEFEEALKKSQVLEETAPNNEDEEQMERDILERMIAAPPPETPAGSPQHHGNLVRELIQVYHAISRNDHGFPPTPTALLCERDGVVYVNQHIAIPVEAASIRPSQSMEGHVVRPYYTLLFPRASPSEFLQAFQVSGGYAPRRLQQLLLTVNAQKQLTEIAVDANLPLYTAMEIATHLLTHGACVASPVVTRQSRLACLNIQKIPKLTLEFSQTFPGVHLVRLVSFLTSSASLGEAMSILTNLSNAEGVWLRECLLPAVEFPLSETSAGVLAPTSPEVVTQSPSNGVTIQDHPLVLPRWIGELEDALFAMTIWLLSHYILVQMQDYLVAVGQPEQPRGLVSAAGEGATSPTPISKASTSGPRTSSPFGAGGRTASTSSNNIPDENLFKELLESSLLAGNISIMALSWRLGMDQKSLRSWGLRHPRIRIVSRVPAPGDDWKTDQP